MDQVLDKYDFGIPLDVELARDQAAASARAAEASAEASAESAADAEASAGDAEAQASRAQAAADEAEAWATAKAGISLGPDEPPEPTPGSVWLATTEDAPSVVSAIRRYDAGAAGEGLFPGAATWPGTGTFPNVMGAWFDYTLAPSLVAAE